MRLYELVPVEDTFHQRVAKPAAARLTPELIALNYASLSPFPGGETLFRQAGEHVDLWFTRRPLAPGRRVPVPEAYLYFKQFAARRNAVIVHRRRGAVVYVVCGAAGPQALVTRLHPAALAAGADDPTPALLAREHSLVEPELVELERDPTPAPDGADLLAFCRWRPDARQLGRRLLADLKPAIAAGLALWTFLGWYEHSNLDRLARERRAELAKWQEQNRELRIGATGQQAESEFWRRFGARERGAEEVCRLLADLSRIVAADGGRLSLITVLPGQVECLARMKKVEGLVDTLLATGHFSAARILSGQLDKSEPGVQVLQLQLDLLPPAAGRSGKPATGAAGRPGREGGA